MAASESDQQIEVRPMTAEDAVGVAELVRRCYGDSYLHEQIYDPERFFADQEAGLHISEVAVAGKSDVVGHWAFVFHGAAVAESGMTITDERYRGHGVASRMEAKLHDRLVQRGVKWVMGEPVLVHTATQEIVVTRWKQGAITGVRLKSIPHLDLEGFKEQTEAGRISLAVAFGPLAPMRKHDVWLSPEYAELVALVIEPTDWPRTIRTEPPQDLALPEATVLSSTFNDAMASAVIEVETIGADLHAAVAAARDEAQAAGARFIELRIPTNEPASALAGLLDQGFSFAAFLPEMRGHADLLLLQWLDNPQVDRSTWQLLNPHIEALAAAIVAQAELASERNSP
jgi:GNAT superfamily N-acetyltransferase